MNYYSNEIVNHIIDTSELNNIIDAVSEFEDDVHMLFVYFAFHKINLDYIYNILADKSNEIVFRGIDTCGFNIRNCPSAMIYRKYKRGNTRIYYILMICTKQSFKKFGYASAMLDDFIGRMKERRNDGIHKIVLSSVDTAVSYYQKYGFAITTDTLKDHPVLHHYEIPECDKPPCIMELII